MKNLSKAALLAALMLGASGLVIEAPAVAKKKEEPATAAGPKLSPEFRKAAQAAQTQLAAKTWATAEPAVAAAEAAATTDDDKYYAQSFRLQLTAGKITADAAGDSKAYVRLQQQLVAPLDALIANPKTPPKDQGRFNYLRGQIDQDAGKFKEATAFYERARALGFEDPDLPISIVKVRVDGGDIAGGIAELRKIVDQQIAAGKTPPESYYSYAIARLSKAGMRADMLQWLQMWVRAYPKPENWRQTIVLYAFEGKSAAQFDKRQRIDMFRLMRATRALADELDYNDYAQTLIDVGLPAEAKAIIDEGRAAGKLKATNVMATNLYASAQRAIAADQPLAAQEKAALASPKGDPSVLAADAYLSHGNYAKAAELYRAGLTKPFDQPGSAATKKNYLTADEVNTHLGIALAMAGDKEGAKAAFQLVKGTPRGDIAKYWLVFLDQSPAAAAAPAN